MIIHRAGKYADPHIIERMSFLGVPSAETGEVLLGNVEFKANTNP